MSPFAPGSTLHWHTMMTFGASTLIDLTTALRLYRPVLPRMSSASCGNCEVEGYLQMNIRVFFSVGGVGNKRAAIQDGGILTVE